MCAMCNLEAGFAKADEKVTAPLSSPHPNPHFQHFENPDLACEKTRRVKLLYAWTSAILSGLEASSMPVGGLDNLMCCFMTDLANRSAVLCRR